MEYTKHITHIKNVVCLVFLLASVSCSIDDVVPNNQLLENTVITDEASAVNVLNRIHNSGLRNRAYGSTAGAGGEGLVELYSISDQYIDYLQSNPDYLPFSTNSVLPNSFFVTGLYRDLYFNINLANFFIEIVERGDANVTPERQAELLAEARFFRGLSHFNLLRAFGQFYDMNSQLGIVVSLAPIRDNSTFPRNSVQDAYNAILADLEFAADNATNGREHFYVSATAARAFLARVQLYAGDFASAASNALAVINNTDGYSLDPSYSNIFASRYGSETLLAAYTGGTEGNQGNQFVKSDMQPSVTLINLADDQDGVSGNGSADFATGYDPRFSLGFGPGTIGEENIGKYPNGLLGSNAPTNNNAIQNLRMGEIYLIFAEAEARRSGGSLANALQRLNDIRNRAGVASKTLSDQATLLEDIRQEKVLELYAENAEHWFDLVRYHTLGDIDALSVKPTLISVNQFILPIPIDALSGNPELVQNP